MTAAARLRSHKTGLPPGTLVHVGATGAAPVTIRLFDFDEKNLEERALDSVEEIEPYLQKETVTWVDVCGVHDVAVIQRIGEMLGIHPLVLEDVVNTHQRPKSEAYEDHLFVVLKMARYDLKDGDLDLEQVSLILGDHFVITFQERPGDVFEPIRERIRKGKGRVRKSGPDYLCYALLDVVVDNYFLVLEGIGESIEDLEDDLVGNPTRDDLERIHRLRRLMVDLRKAVWPMRELTQSIDRSESPLIQPGTSPFLRDVHDHAVQVIDTVETYRDILTGLLDLYLSGVSNRMNEVMKVLTVIATIFIPLTFIAGIYGMNFEHMPELKWRWAYPVLWLVMVVLGAAMVVQFRRRKWL